MTKGKLILDFSCKTVVVTGAGSGIGAATAEMFCQQGAKLVLLDRDEQGLVTVIKKCEEVGATPNGIACDLSEIKNIDCVAKKTRKHIKGKLDVLVNGAGVMPSTGTLENTNLECLKSIFDINVRSMFYLTQQFLPELLLSKGNIVNISSVAGLCAFPNLLAYNMSKAAVDQFTRSLAMDLGPLGVRVNAVNPGVIRTNLQLSSGWDKKTYDDLVERSKTMHVLGRVGEPHEVAACICFLAHQLASFVTGVTFCVDGGGHVMCSR